MGQVFLYMAFLAVAAAAVFAVNRLLVQQEKRDTSLFYNLGTPCPAGVAQAPCPHCGQLFGTDATETARQKCENELKKGPPVQGETVGFIELVQMIWWNVVCPACGEQSSYIPQAKILLYQTKG